MKAGAAIGLALGITALVAAGGIVAYDEIEKNKCSTSGGTWNGIFGGGCSTSTPTLSAPANFKITYSTPTSDTVSCTASWDAVSGASYYELTLNGTAYQVTAPTTSYGFTAPAGTTVAGSVTACSTNMECSNAATTTVTVPQFGTGSSVPATPGAPTLVSYPTPTGPQGGSVIFDWPAVAGATSYEIYHSGAPQTAGVTITGTQATVTGLAAPGIVNFAVAACNSSGVCSQPSPTTEFTTPSYAAPVPATPGALTETGSQASSVNVASISFSWAAVTGAQYYYIYDPGSGVPYGPYYGTSATITGLAPGSKFTAELGAYNTAGHTTGSSQVFTTASYTSSGSSPQQCTSMAVLSEPNGIGGTQPSWIEVNDFLAPCGITFSDYQQYTKGSNSANASFNSSIIATNPSRPQDGSYLIDGETCSDSHMYRDRTYLNLVLTDLMK